MEEFYPQKIFEKFDLFLAEQGLSFKDGVVIGGAAIAMVYGGQRLTRDVDLLTPIPDVIKRASIEFATKEGLSQNWLNNRVVNLDSCKPFGWGKDLLPIYLGKNLSLFTVSRQNLLQIKLFSYCDRPEGLAIDFPDIVLMKPTKDELAKAAEWIMDQIRKEKRPKTEQDFFAAALADLSKKLQNGIS